MNQEYTLDNRYYCQYDKQRHLPVPARAMIEQEAISILAQDKVDRGKNKNDAMNESTIELEKTGWPMSTKDVRMPIL